MRINKSFPNNIHYSKTTRLKMKISEARKQEILASEIFTAFKPLLCRGKKSHAYARKTMHRRSFLIRKQKTLDPISQAHNRKKEGCFRQASCRKPGRKAASHRKEMNYEQRFSMERNSIEKTLYRGGVPELSPNSGTAAKRQRSE